MKGVTGSAGTAGDGFRVEPAPHRFEPDAVDYGHVPACRRCEERRGHPNHDVPAGRAS